MRELVLVSGVLGMIYRLNRAVLLMVLYWLYRPSSRRLILQLLEGNEITRICFILSAASCFNGLGAEINGY